MKTNKTCDNSNDGLKKNVVSTYEMCAAQWIYFQRTCVVCLLVSTNRAFALTSQAHVIKVKRTTSLEIMWNITIIEQVSVSVYGQTCPWAWSTSQDDPAWPCYLISNKIQRTWGQARKFCQQMGGDLIKVDSEAEMVGYTQNTTQYWPDISIWWHSIQQKTK